MVLTEKIAHWPKRGPDICFDASTAPQLAIVVHTEEEFDWNAPFDRAANTVRHVPELYAFQSTAMEQGFAPHYSCGYPIARDPDAAAFFKPLFAAGEASLGAHLHPWVCPPFEELVTNKNSFPGNLPAALEEAKLAALTQQLEETFGIRPNAYLAGRYGYGPGTSAALSNLGYTLDFSVAPGWDYQRNEGPNWRDHSAMAFFNADYPKLLHVPHSGGHVGFLCRAGMRQLKLPEAGAAAALKLPSIAARLGAVRQARITIEGMELSDMKALARALFAGGVRLFTLSFHSPSAGVGWTPYARTSADRDALLEKMRAFLRFFVSDLHGVPGSPDSFYAAALAAQSALN
ncbi:MAG: glycosyltransferase, partial [Pseudomonadota bacterium]